MLKRKLNKKSVKVPFIYYVTHLLGGRVEDVLHEVGEGGGTVTDRDFTISLKKYSKNMFDYTICQEDIFMKFLVIYEVS